MKQNKRLNKVWASVIAFAMILSLIPLAGLGGFTASAATSPFKKVSDFSTMDGWKAFFGTEYPSTENAGAVWTDKSVFSDNSQFLGLTDAYGEAIVPTVSDDSFLVALSAIASNKSIVGYSHIPTDTVLLLDISGSMGPDNNDAVSDLVLAANAAITGLLDLNYNNRIGVILYSAEYDEGNDFHSYTLLPIDRYTATSTVTYDNGTEDTSDDIEVGKFLETNPQEGQWVTVGSGRGSRQEWQPAHNGDEISIASGVKTGSGSDVDIDTVDVIGGTYIQGGLKAAADLFEAQKNDNDTVVQGDGFQGGTQRKPILVMMSDGAPTYASTNYTNPGDPNRGSGGSTTQGYAFLTQLTAAYLKNEISEYYNGSEALFYTLGLGVGNDSIARSVLDPENSTPTLDTYWENYAAASDGASVEIVNEYGSYSDIYVTKTSKVDDIVFSNGYFAADTSKNLFLAFDKIVQEIIIQSLYRPTLVEENQAHMDGYIEFIDDIGDYMSIREIEGILIGKHLYTGAKLSENFKPSGGTLGSITNPNELGDHLIWAVKERLGIQDTKTAQALVTLAYEHDQLKWTDKNNYSNYIGWYADADGNYLGFWDQSHTYKQAPANAAYVNKSYGMLGDVSDGYNVSDLMYISIQVHTELVDQTTAGASENDLLDTGHSQLIFRIPASLIPVVTYDVSLEGTNYDNAKNVEMTIEDAEPIRLLFEVGLREDLTVYNIEKELGSSHRNNDGTYSLYTNAWSVEQFNKGNSTDPQDYVAPSKAINTVAFFEPNLQNERYYYTEPTPVYVKQGNDYVKYSSDVKPLSTDGNEYYRQIQIFELTADKNDGNEAVHNKTYERISAQALEEVVKSDTNGGWNIPKDIIHRVYDVVEVKKVSAQHQAENPTGTLEYSFYPSVEHLEGVHYYADAIHGNNGKLTVTPAIGLIISKTTDETLAGSTTRFAFEIQIEEAASNTYTALRTDTRGELLAQPETVTFDGNGKATVFLTADTSLYLLDLPVDAAYTVTENTSGANYEVKTSAGTTGTIENFSLKEATFENTLKQDGNLVVSKRVNHPFTSDPEALKNKTFRFDVVLSKDGAAYPHGTVEAYYASDPGTSFTLDVSDNKIENAEVHANEALIIKILEGWTAEVTEDTTSMPAGFRLDETQTQIPNNKVIATDANVVYQFVNTYTPAPVSPEINLSASKILTGRDWKEDSFTFVLSRYDTVSASYTEIGRETVSQDQAPNGTGIIFGTLLTQALQREAYSAVGTYHYSITELIPDETKGITYDGEERNFNVIVTDTDMDGALEIADVTNATRTTVNKAQTSSLYTVTAEAFKNVYKASGIAEITVDIQKTVDAPEGTQFSPAGFEFTVYDKETGAMIGESVKTDENGNARFIFAFNTDGIDYKTDKKVTYVIRETNSHIPGMIYAEDLGVNITVSDQLDGTIRANAILEYDGENDPTWDAYTVRVINTYVPENTETSVTINVEKTVQNTGTATIGPEGFEFTLTGADENTLFPELKKKTDVNGKVSFVLDYTEKDLDKTYTYTLKEVKGTLANVQYSETVYTVTVTVRLDENNKVVAEVSLNGTEDPDGTVNAKFVNVHTGNLPDPTPTPTPEPEPPQDPVPTPVPENPSTSDVRLLPAWILLMVIVTLVAAVAIRREKNQ